MAALKETQKITEQPEGSVEKVAKLIGNVDSIFDMQDVLRAQGYKADYVSSGRGYYIMAKKSGEENVLIAPSDMVDDAEMVVGKYSLGVLEGEFESEVDLSEMKTIFIKNMNRLDEVYHNRKEIKIKKR